LEISKIVISGNDSDFSVKSRDRPASAAVGSPVPLGAGICRLRAGTAASATFAEGEPVGAASAVAAKRSESPSSSGGDHSSHACRRCLPPSRSSSEPPIEPAFASFEDRPEALLAQALSST
jgi:hypothetical protein